MAYARKPEAKKWVNATVLIGAVIVGYTMIRFILQLGEWFDLEAKVNYFRGWAQALGFVSGIGTYFAVVLNGKAVGYLDEVYSELVKVIWPEKEGVAKLTVGIVIGLILVSIVLALIDVAARHVLSYLY